MAISISAIKTAYVSLGLLVTATKSAYSTRAGRGARPTYPVDTTADADYNDVTAAIIAWDASYASDTTAINTAIAAQIAGELVVTNLMPPNQWVRLTTLTNWTATTQYIGCPCPSNNVCITTDGTIFSILSVNVLPTRAFPLS